MGLMVGSIVKLWPLQRPNEKTADLDLKNRVMEYVSPREWDGSLLLLLFLTASSFVIVLTIEWYGKRHSDHVHAGHEAN